MRTRCCYQYNLFRFGAHFFPFILGQVIPFSRGSAWEQPPPDLASYLYKNRIVYLGMSLVPSVTELILAEFLYLQYEDDQKPIYLYINSTGTTKVSNLFIYTTQDVVFSLRNNLVHILMYADVFVSLKHLFYCLMLNKNMW